MKAIGVWNWTLPAWAGRLPDGRTYNTCPSAGICAQVCYARTGSYLWPVVRAKHQANLMFVLDDLPGWQAAMTAELGAHKFHRAWIRIHDSGDFFTDDYLRAWLRICHARPEVNFYAYTKEIDRFRRLVEPDPPTNFWWVYSYGGTQDHHLHADADRVADVFPTKAPSPPPDGHLRKPPTCWPCSAPAWSASPPTASPRSSNGCGAAASAPGRPRSMPIAPPDAAYISASPPTRGPRRAPSRATARRPRPQSGDPRRPDHRSSPMSRQPN